MLANAWIAAQKEPVSGAVPLLALNRFAQARDIDAGCADGPCVDAYLKGVQWVAVAARYAAAVNAASEGLSATLDGVSDAVVIDVRRAGVFENANAMLPGAQWRDPANIAQWMGTLPQGREILVYCVFGHEASRNSAVRLRAHGFNAWYLEGGIDAWQMAGRPLVSKEA
jgi:Fe-Mn family superoxide dismutase